MFTIESICQKFGRGERMKIKAFKTNNAMYKILNAGENTLNWRISDKNLKREIYAYTRGAWHNVKSLDYSILAHI